MSNIVYKDYILKGATIFNGESCINNHNIVISNGYIADIIPQNTNNCNFKEYNLSGLTISAGFIDLQINGCGGVLFNDDISANSLQIMKETNLKYGCTSFLPTLITTTQDKIIKALQVVYDYHTKYPNCVLGIHIEGPYISKIKKGAHNASYIKPIDIDMVNILCSYAKKMVVKLTIAPEENSLDLIKILLQGGVKLSIGHSNATYTEATDGIKAGINLSTHLFNAMSAFEGRKPGVVGAILNSNIYAGIIADGIHVDYNSINLVKKIKQSKLYLVTDAVSPMGTNITEFVLGDKKVFVKDDMCINEDGALAGANIDMMSSIRNCVNFANINLEESLRMATIYPANAIENGNLGRLTKNNLANLVAFDNNYNVKHTIQDGILTSYN